MNQPIIWIAFTAAILFLLLLDLGVFHRKNQRVSLREAATWTIIWVSLAMAFNLLIFFWQGPKPALEYLTGYLIEKSLSVDNIFVFVMLFSYFRVPEALQHRVLFWGIIGAIVMRATLILIGAALIARFHWVIYIFGAFLVITGLRLFFHKEEEIHPENNPVFNLFRRLFPLTPDYVDGKFFVREAGRLFATPLALVLVMIETTDLVFALDSIPAIFGITRDPFIVYSSNIFAILGLRSLYFLLAGVIGMFRYLQVGLSGVLIFIGVKMLISGFYHIPIVASLGVVFAILATSILTSLRASAKEARILAEAVGLDTGPPGESENKEKLSS
ncbi:MAG: TerC family protein [Armatimonadetes bacterium]|nr:TerC family protein [Armatimonadota bacterium]